VLACLNISSRLLNRPIDQPTNEPPVYRCAACVEELTGRPILDPSSVAEDVSATDFGPVGNYALQVTIIKEEEMGMRVY